MPLPPHDNLRIEAMKQPALQRQRGFWTWMALLPGLLSPVGGCLVAWLDQPPSSASVSIFWLGLLFYAIRLGFVLYAILSLVWIFRCAQKLGTLARAEHGSGLAANGYGMMILFIVGNSILGVALIYGACAMMR